MFSQEYKQVCGTLVYTSAAV